MLGKKRKRVKTENQYLKLKIEKKEENFELITYKLKKADELFIKYKAEKTKKRKWELINQIVELVEINPIFNYALLNLNKEFDKEDYDDNFKQLSPTLSANDYYSLTKKNQENPSMKLFNLLNLYLKDEKEFDNETKLIINNKYNIPLIEGNEKIRINQYIQLFAHYEIYLNKNQKNFLANNKYEITNKDKRKINALQQKYNIAKKGIKLFKDIIPQMKKFFNEINLEENNLNIKILTFLFYVTDIIQRIQLSGIEPTTVKNFFEKEIAPTKEIEENNSLINLIKLEKNLEFPDGYGIKKKNDNKEISNEDKEKDKKMNEYIIFNEFETIEFDGRYYVINNLIEDFKNNAYIPLEILLLRNQSLSFFEQNNNRTNFLNTNNIIYNEFKSYFKFFIKSKCVQEALRKDNRYENIITLINDENIISKFLDDKYLKSIPLFDFAGSGYTNKDLLISCISGLPFKIYNYNAPNSLEEYKNLKGIIILFNVGMKTITTLHELIIHLCFGYLNYLTEGKISYESPKKGYDISTKDGGLFFEQLLFGVQYGDIKLNDVLVILNGDCFNSLDELQKNLRKEFFPDKFKVKSKLLKLILKEYSIDLKNLKNTNEIYSTMKSSNNGMCIRRNIKNIILPYKSPDALN